MRSRALTAVAAASLGIVGCIQPRLPAPASPHPAMQIDAPVAKTWDSVIELFAAEHVPVRTLERASGFISTDPLGVGDMQGNVAEYDCGSDRAGTRIPASTADYTVLVRGDESASTIRVSVRWKTTRTVRVLFTSEVVSSECTSQGGWERAFEQQVKERAEAGSR